MAVSRKNKVREIMGKTPLNPQSVIHGHKNYVNHQELWQSKEHSSCRHGEARIAEAKAEALSQDVMGFSMGISMGFSMCIHVPCCVKVALPNANDSGTLW